MSSSISSSVYIAPYSADDAMASWPNTPEDMRCLQIALKAHAPWMYKYLSEEAKPRDPRGATKHLISVLTRLQLRFVRATVPCMDDKSIAKVVWFGPLGEYPRSRGWEWLCGEIAEIRQAAMVDSESPYTSVGDELNNLLQLYASSCG
jgi:hypothetical protein